ncbi:ABC-three component system protein [Photobacterium phosphoreum]|uniref:ABC-three component system protein n=1 Tax=Photobacterium phosphoreum TaxID=659 RepID=UPI0039AF20D3
MDNNDLRFRELLSPKDSEYKTYVSSSRVKAGKIISPRQHLLLISAEDWEVFVSEWGLYQKGIYRLVTRLGGANDYGIDVACFKSELGFNGTWDNFQCKYYKGDPLAPSTAIPEIGKIIWHIFKKEITSPENYYFFSPKDCSPSLKKLLLNYEKLKEKVINDWDKSCSNKITTTTKIELTGEFESFLFSFDFSIFKYKPVDQVIEEYRETPYFSFRFGGGLKDRPNPDLPPKDLEKKESNYTNQLIRAYAHHEKIPFESFDFNQKPQFIPHFNRQREAFYSAESLRAFARDSILPGVFTELQKDMMSGVIDVVEDDWDSGYRCVKEVLKESKSVPIEANGLFEVVRVQDRYGICHQLSNDLKIKWVK